MNKFIDYNWWKYIFDKRYLKTYIDFYSVERTKKEEKFIVKIIEKFFPHRSFKNIKILDCGCGYGRLTLPLAEKGFKITGLDYSKYLLSIAKKKAKELNLENIRFIRQDMRNFYLKNEYHVILSIFTSFGYFLNKEDDIKVLKNFYKSLKRGGCLILDLENPIRIISSFINNGSIDKKGFLFYSFKNKLSNNLDVLTKVTFNHQLLGIILEREWFENKKRYSYKAFFRLYYLEEILNYLKLIGFNIYRVYGNFDSKRYNEESSPRIIVVAYRNGKS